MFQRATYQNTIVIDHLLLPILIGKPFLFMLIKAASHSLTLLIILSYFLHRTYHYLQTSYLFTYLLASPHLGWKLQKTENFVCFCSKYLQHLAYSRHSFVEQMNGYTYVNNLYLSYTSKITDIFIPTHAQSYYKLCNFGKLPLYA